MTHDRIIHLGGNRLGDRILQVLRSTEPSVTTVTTLEELDLATCEGAAWLVSSGFRSIVPGALLSRAGRACNVHTALLPWGRGADPNVWAIASGEPAGVSIHEMVEGLDRGPILVQEQLEVLPADTGASLYRRLEDLAVELFERSWPAIRAGDVVGQVQSEGGSYHRRADLGTLFGVDRDTPMTFGQALDLLRAGTNPPHPNVTVDSGGTTYRVDVQFTPLDEPAE